MNKVFKVVYSKSKGCYVVVPETAKNNNGKKKVLASVLAGFAVAGAMGGIAPLEVQAGIDTNNSHVNIWAETSPKSNGQNYNVGQNSIVVGYQNTTDNVAGHDGKVAIGAKNTSTNNASTAVGNENKATGGAATAVGAGNNASGKASVALGNVNNADAKAAVAIGTYNNVNYTKGSWETTPKQAGEYSTVVGNYSSATGTSASAMGVYTNATGAGSFAAGYNNNAKGQNSVAIGSENTSHVADTVTLGQFNNAKTMGGISIGKNNLTDSTNGGRNAANTSDENSQIAIGRDNVATHLDTIAVGRETSATGSGATVIGARAEASGNNSIAIGQSGKGSPKVIASGVNSIAIGMQSQATGESAIAEGPGSRAGGKYGVALGRTSKANAEATTALGNAAEANIANGVALGSSSVTTTDKGVLGYNPSDPHERKYAPLTGNVQTATTAAVSIGNGQQMTRQLTGLAAGTADTDAVNVAQLKNVGVAVTGNTGKSDFLTDGGKLNVIGTGRVSTVAAHDGAKDSKITVGFDDKGMVKAGKNVTVDEKTVDGRTTYTINAASTAAKYDFLTNAKANGGNLDGTAKPATVASGNTVNYAAGKNLTVKQDIEQSIGEQTYTYSLNKDLKEITSITNNGGPTMHFGGDNISITGGNLDLGDNNITNLKSGGDVINNAANIGDVTRISKANDKHIKPGEYAVDNNGKVTMTYVDGNNKDVPNETAVITGIAKQDLSNINNGGKTVIKNLAKEAIDMENGKNTTASHRDVNGVKTFKVDVEGDLTDITSITNKAGDGKIAFGGNQTVNVAGDHNIAINAKAGDITGLTNVTLDAPDFAKKGRAATEEQLKIVNNGFNNTVGLTGNTGATDLQKLNKQGGLSFGVVGANNGEYIKTTAAGSDVVADLSDSAKNKLNSTVEVQGKNAAKVTSSVVQNADGSTKTIYTVDVNNVKPTAASTEKVQAKADVAGSSDKNIAKVAPKAGENFGDAGATYEVNVSRNDVKDAAREAVTVNTTNTTNNPITVTPVQDETNHNTTYTVTFDGNKAATQIPLTYKANGQNAQTVTLDKGLNFVNGKNTTASVDAEGVVKYDVNKDLVNINSISNTTNGPKMEFGPNSINITNGPINMGDQNITNLKSGGDVINNAANIGDVKRISKDTDLHIAPTTSNRQGETTTSYAYDAASKSVTLKYNDGNGTTQAGTIAKIDLSGLADQIKDGYSFSTDAKGNVVGNHAVTAVGNGKTVSYAAGDNLTVKQDIDATTGEHTYTYALSNDIKVGKDGKDGKPGVDGKIGVNGKDGSSVVINGKDGSIGLNGKDGKDGLTMKAEKGQPGVNGKDGITRIVYEDKTNIKHEVATLDDGMKYAGDDAQGADKTKVIAKKLNQTLDIVGGADTTKLTDNNIGVNNVDGKLKVQLAQNINLTPAGSLTIGDTMINNGGLTISGGPSITKTGINAGNLNITNVKAGVNNTDAVNVQQLKDARTLVTSNDNSVTINKTESGNQITYDLHVAPGAAQSVWNVKSSGNTTADSEATAKTITDGKTVEMVAGKNLTVKQTSNNDGAKVEYALSGNLTNINTIKNEGPATFTIGGNEFKFEGGNVNMGDNNITNLKSGGDVINNAANIGDVNRISKANDKHIKPGEYGVDNNGKVTMTYVDGNNKDISNETAVITGIAKSDLSNITKGGETVIQNIAKKFIDMEDGKNTKASNRDVNGVKTFKVDVEGDLTDVTSITNKSGDGKVSFVGNQTVNVAGDHNIALNAKAGDITGLTNVTLNSADFATKGRAATEEQLKIVNNGFNNTVGLTGNTGATDLQKLNQAGGLSFGVIGANNGQYIKTTAAGSNVAVDLSDDAKAKLNNTVEVRGKNAAKVTSVTENTADGGKKTIYTVDVDNVKPTAASTEKVQAKADVAGSSDKNIAKVTPQAGDQFGDAGATYEVNVSRNDVKDAAREAVTVNTTNTTNNPITVTPVQDETNHNTTYQVTFDGNKAATQIPLTYKANGQNAQTVTLDKGLNFTNGSNTTASVAADGVVKYDLNNNIDLTPNGSLKIGDTIVNNGGLTISGGPSITKTGINAGNLNITNVKAGVNNTDAVNVQQLKDARTVVTSNDNSVTINKTESGNQITYDLHVAPGAAQSVWNVKSSGNTTADSEATAKTITDGKTVEMVAGKNLTVKQTSNNDGAKVEYALSDDIKVGNDGKDGKPGKDGSIGVNGKDGSSVVINGKDGSIGLNGKDGKDGLTMKAENGQPGVNGKDGITRIVYEDKTNTKHEVATLDDGLKFTGNNTDTVNNHKLNSLVKVQGEGVDKTTSATFKSAAGNINVKADGTDTLEVQLNKDLKNITTIKNDGPATLTIGGNEFKFSGGNVNMGDNNITNLKSGGDVINNAANIGDVKRISKANDLHIAPTTSDRAGETTATYAYNTADKSVTLKYNDGNGVTQTGTIAKIDLSGLADQIKDGYSFSTDAKGNVVGNHAVTAVGNGKTVSYAAGDNLTIAQHIDNATGEQTYTYALSNDIKVGKDGKDGKPGVDGKIGVNGKDGSAVVINGKDGSIGLNGKDGKDGLTMKAKDGQPGVNGKDGITRIVYEDNSKNTHEVATLDDGMKYAGDDAQGADKSKVIAKKLNQTMDIVGGANSTKLTDNNIGVNNVDGKLKVQLAQNINLTPAGSLTIGDTMINNGGLTISGGPSITKTGINAGNKTIVNVDAGVNDTDAVNVQQLKKAKTEVKAGNNVTVDTTYGNDGHTIYTVNANDVALGDAVLKYSANGTNTQSVKLSQGLNFVDGNYTSASVDANGQVKYDVTIGKVKDGVDGKPGVDGKDGIATVKTVVDTINNSGWKGDVTGNTVNNHAATIVKPGTTVNFGAGKNLTVEQIVDQVTGNHTYNYALSDDIKVGHDGKDGKPGVDGKIGVNGKDGSSVVINGKDGSIGLNGKDGKDGLTMKAKDGQPGVNGKDGITRIVYEDNSKNTHEVATLDDGMKYAGDDAQGADKSKVIAKKLNQTMDIVGGANSTKLTDNNIGVNNVDGKLKVQLAQNIDLTPAGSLTIGGTSITDNGLVINQGPSITKGGINAGNQFITNVKAGVNNTDAVNVAQLKSAKTEVEEGDNVKVTSRTGADGQTIYKVSAKAVNLGDAELKYSANGTNTQSVKLSQGLNFVDGNFTTASVDANGQVKYDVTIGKVKDGVDGKPGVDGKDGIATVKTVVDTINNSGWKANATGNVVGNSTATIVKPGNTVNYGAGKNLNVKQTVNGDEQTYEFALDKDLKELNSVQTKNIYLGSPTSHTTITYNNDNSRIEYTTKEGDKKQVANLDDIWTIQANGTDVKPVGGKVNVVGGDHIKVSTDAAGKMTISADGLGTMNGFNVKSTGNTTSDSDKTAKNITDGKTVEFSGGKNLTVKQTNTADGAKVEFALNNNIDLTPNGSVTIGDTVVNNDGLTITGGPTITKNNVDMGGQQIHNVKSGGDVDSNGANIGDIKRISKANDTRIKDGNYEVSQNGTVEMTYVDGAGKQVVDANGNPVKATISGIARQDLSNITNEGKKVITGLSSIVKGGNNVTVDTSVDNTTGQKTYTVNADLSGAKVNASVGADGSGVAKGLKNPVKVEKGTQYIAGDNMVVERKPVEGDDKIDNSITYSLAHDLTEIKSISNGGATLRINSNPGSVPGDRAPVTPAFEVHGGNLSMTGNRIVNLAPGIAGTDGVNVDQLKGSRTTLTSQDNSVTLNRTDNGQGGYNYDLSVKGVNDPRVNILNEEIGLVGAQGAALSALKPMQYDPMEPTQIMAGYGNYRGNSALALGVAHYKNESTMFHGGISWAGGSSHMMANAGVTWKIGNRDSEGAVADRYRKGPISSTYAMQTEVASMKAQNAGLKGEVSDLKAENEQIKAQNAGLQNEVDQLKAQMAAMMARLGM